jgi:hypothetical protein
MQVSFQDLKEQGFLSLRRTAGYQVSFQELKEQGVPFSEEILKLQDQATGS